MILLCFNESVSFRQGAVFTNYLFRDGASLEMLRRNNLNRVGVDRNYDHLVYATKPMVSGLRQKNPRNTCGDDDFVNAN
jgi:hypothetical protein